MNEVFFFDTYAFIEVIRGNPNYKRFENFQVITAIFNLAELNYILKKEMSKEMADSYTREYWAFLVDVSLQDILHAMDFKTKSRGFSIPDAVGYIVAARLGAKFLTGDAGFKDMHNVEFVK